MPNIAVIGCGVIGLTTALEIQKRLGSTAKVTIFTENVSPNTTSDVAAGIWVPYLLQDTDTAKSNKWAKGTLDYLVKLWKEGKAKEAGICLQPTINLTDIEDYQHRDWLPLSLGYAELSTKYLNDMSKRLNTPLKGGYMFTTVTWEGTSFLPFLQKQFITNGGKIVFRSIKTISELSDYDIIVNCPGLNARELVNDAEMYPLRGQIIRAEAPGQFHSYFTKMNDDNQSCYIILNKDRVVLGGTKQKEYNLQVNEADTRKIITNCTNVVPQLIDAKNLKHQVGLRPARNQVRLEAERMVVNGKHLNVVHNYGHGGSGVTLSVGCAIEAAEMVEECLTNNVLVSKL